MVERRGMEKRGLLFAFGTHKSKYGRGIKGDREGNSGGWMYSESGADGPGSVFGGARRGVAQSVHAGVTMRGKKEGEKRSWKCGMMGGGFDRKG